jgi:large subunit ribosomal protein L31e
MEEGEGEEQEKTEEGEQAEVTGAAEEKESEEKASEEVEEEVEEAEEEKVETAEETLPAGETKPPRKEAEEEEFVEERIYTIPLSKAWIVPANKRAPKAMRIIKAFVTKHMKLKARREEVYEEGEEEPRTLIIDNEVNERIWRRGVEKPPRRVRIRAAKDKEGNVTVFLAEGD